MNEQELRKSIGVTEQGYASVFCPINANQTPEIYVVLPGGQQLMRVPEVGDELTARRFADFVAAAINAKLSPLPPTLMPHQMPTKA